MPNRPDTFDTAFRTLGSSFATKGKCSWSNYVQFNAHLEDVQRLLTGAGVEQVSLLDAHSFCWMLVRLPAELGDNDRPEPEAKREPRRKKDPGRRLGARERSIVEMVRSVLATVKQSIGPDIERRRKLKELTMSEAELRAYIPQLLNRQDDCCALTGIALQWHGEQDDPQLLPSLDRIDSSGNYEVGNLQVVCRFVNFWKGDSDDEEFRRLLGLVRGLPE